MIITNKAIVEIDSARLYEALNAQRAAAGLSWRQLAEHLGTVGSTFTRLSQGKSLSAATYVACCGWLGMDARWFLTNCPSPSPPLTPSQRLRWHIAQMTKITDQLESD